jgi:hypothetical protein
VGRVVISRAFFLFFPCNHIINIKKKSFPGEAKNSVIFSFLILLHKRAKPIHPPYIHLSAHLSGRLRGGVPGGVSGLGILGAQLVNVGRGS